MISYHCLGNSCGTSHYLNQRKGWMIYPTQIVWCHPCFHDDVIKWKHFPRYWPFVRGTHRPPVNLPHKGQWRGALMFSLICVWISGWVNYREAGDSRRYHIHYDVTVMNPFVISFWVAINILRPRQNGRHLPDDNFKCIFLNANLWISFKISLKFVPERPINNIPALVQIMVWRRSGDKPLSESVMI